MRKLARWSSGLSAAALVAASFTLSAPALADDETAEGSQDAVAAEELPQSGEDAVNTTHEEPQSAEEPQSGQSDAPAADVPRSEEVLAAPDIATIQLLNINDFHGRIDGTLSASKDALTASSTMQFAYTIEALKASADTLFLSAGDNIGASLFASAVQKDKPTIELLKALGLQASAVGNHEFDGGKTWIAEVNGWINGAFPYLAANVIDDSTGQVAAPFKASATFDVNGTRVAVIGAVTQETPSLVSPAGVAGFSFTDPVDAVNAEAARLMALPESERPHVIVAEYHDGAAEGQEKSTLSAELAASPTFKKLVEQTSSDVDVLFTGHTHKQYAWEAPYGTEGKTRPVVQTGSYGQNIGQVILQVDRTTGDVTVQSAANIPTANSADMATLRGLNAATESAYQIILAALQTADSEGSKVTGRISASITRAYTGGEYVDGKWAMTEDSKEDRGGASPLGTLVSNMLRHELGKIGSGVDFGVTNPGGMRIDLIYKPEVNGNITVAEARSLMPFNNELAIVTMTGDQIYTMLEQQWQRTDKGEVPTRPFLYLGLSDNVRYTYHEIADPAIPGATKGVVDSVFIDGKQIDRSAQYRVGTFNFLATGGDNFWVFQNASSANTGLLDYEQWLNYLASESGEGGIAPDFTKQGIKVELDPADGKVKADETLKATYSNLNIHAVGAPANPTASLAVTTPSGVQTLEGSVSNAKDDGGFWRDSVAFEFKAPADVKSGDLVLDLTAAPTGSVATSFGTVTAAPVPDPTCKTGEVLVDGKCMPKPTPDPTCKTGETLVDGKCVPKPTPKPTCKSGETLVDGKCVVKPSPNNNGQLPKTGMDSSLLWFLVAGVAATAAGAGITVRTRRS